MTNFKQALLAVAIAAPATLVATGAAAQSVAIADPDAAIANSKAFQAANAQIRTTYKTQIDQVTARRTALTAELQPLATQFETAQRAPGATEASLRPLATNIQAKQEAANRELARLSEPFQRAQAYVVEQLRAKEGAALDSAMKSRGVTLVLSPQAALAAQPAADLTPAITAALDASTPSVSATPPAGWQPGQQGGGAAAPAAGTPAAPAAGKRPAQGR